MTRVGTWVRWPVQPGPLSAPCSPPHPSPSLASSSQSYPSIHVCIKRSSSNPCVPHVNDIHPCITCSSVNPCVPQVSPIHLSAYASNSHQSLHVFVVVSGTHQGKSTDMNLFIMVLASLSTVCMLKCDVSAICTPYFQASQQHSS